MSRKNNTGHNEIIEKVCRDTGYSEDLVRFVLDDFYDSLHWWLTNPLACGTKIIIENVFKIVIQPFHLGKEIAYSEMNGRGDPEYQKARVFYLNKVLEQITKNNDNAKRQASFGYQHARRSTPAWEAKYDRWEAEEAIYPYLRDIRNWRNIRRRRQAEDRVQQDDPGSSS